MAVNTLKWGAAPFNALQDLKNGLESDSPGAPQPSTLPHNSQHPLR